MENSEEISGEKGDVNFGCFLSRTKKGGNPMHVAFFTNTYHPVVSGVVQSICDFRKALIGQGHQVFVFAQEVKGHADTEAFVFRYPALKLPTRQQYPLTIPLSLHIDWLLPSLKVNVIHSHHPFLLGNAAIHQANQLGVPLVFTHHTRYKLYSHYVPLSQKLVEIAIDEWLDEYMSKCHHIIVPSESIKQMLAEEYGITSKITALPTGMNLALYKAADGQSIRQARGWGQDMVLISVGRLAKEKNQDTLLKAAAQVIEKHNNVRLVLIGDGDKRKALETLAGELGIADRVEFTGNIPHPEVIRHLKAANIFCFASITETQGLVTMEAIAAGLPVVAVDAPGTNDVMDNNQEGLLAANNSVALAQAIEQVINDKALRERFKKAAKKRAESLSIEAQAKKLVDIYEQAIEDHKAGRFVQVNRPNIPESRRKRWSQAIDDLLDFDR
jgi:glycosyltransferase involved in cell wall biosynthesis